MTSAAYRWLCSHALFPLHEQLKRHDSVRVRRSLEQTQWWSPERLEALQAERLKRFLCEIGERVPYYRDLFRASGFDPSACAGVADLQRLPLLGKPEVRAHRERLKADGATGLNGYNTGGSSGEPLVFYTSRGRRSHDVAAKWRATRWWGMDIGDPEMVVWGSPIELGAQDRLRNLRDGLMRSWLLPAFDMSEASLERYVEAIRRRRPRMLFGYPSSLTLIARFARGRGIALDDLGVAVAFVTSETLYEEQRETIGAVFGCRVANGYGGRDAGFIAHECPQGSMHISAEDIVVEILDQQGRPVEPGKPGEIVVTHMASADYPFVRYRTGDIGVLGTSGCPCGRGLPVLQEVQGRSTDFIVAADGTVMHGLALIYAIRGLPGIEQFKIVQHDRQHIEVLLVAARSAPASNEAHIREAFRLRLGREVETAIRYVDEVPREASGKYRYVVSKVSNPLVAPQAQPPAPAAVATTLSQSG